MPIISAVPATLIAFFAARAESFTLTRILLVLIALAFLINAAVGVYHAGVEWKWWTGPTSCSGGTAVEWGAGGVASSIEHPQVVSCSEARWRFLLALLRRLECGGVGAARRHCRLRRRFEALTPLRFVMTRLCAGHPRISELFEM